MRLRLYSAQIAKPEERQSMTESVISAVRGATNTESKQCAVGAAECCLLTKE